jgi:hypothetical protein
MLAPKLLPGKLPAAARSGDWCRSKAANVGGGAATAVVGDSALGLSHRLLLSRGSMTNASRGRTWTASSDNARAPLAHRREGPPALHDRHRGTCGAALAALEQRVRPGPQLRNPSGGIFLTWPTCTARPTQPQRASTPSASGCSISPDHERDPRLSRTSTPLTRPSLPKATGTLKKTRKRRKPSLGEKEIILGQPRPSASGNARAGGSADHRSPLAPRPLVALPWRQLNRLELPRRREDEKALTATGRMAQAAVAQDPGSPHSCDRRPTRSRRRSNGLRCEVSGAI